MRNLNAALAAHRLRRQGGFSLVEIAMVLAIIALLVAGIMLFFGTASTAQKTNDAMSELAAVQQTVRSVYAGQADYTGLSETVIANAGQLPRKWVKGVPPAATGLSSPFNAAVTVAPQASAAQFSVTMNNIPDTACSKMVTMDMGTGLVSVVVNGGTAVNGRAMSPTEAQQCTGNANVVVWTFF